MVTMATRFFFFNFEINIVFVSYCGFLAAIGVDQFESEKNKTRERQQINNFVDRFNR